MRKMTAKQSMRERMKLLTMIFAYDFGLKFDIVSCGKDDGRFQWIKIAERSDDTNRGFVLSSFREIGRDFEFNGDFHGRKSVYSNVNAVFSRTDDKYAIVKMEVKSSAYLKTFLKIFYDMTSWIMSKSDLDIARMIDEYSKLIAEEFMGADDFELEALGKSVEKQRSKNNENEKK